MTYRLNFAEIEPPVLFLNNGIAWTVHEYAADSPMAHGAGACLIFECEGVVRRVRTFPVNWRDLEDEKLALLSWKA
jgi:hypothetical protein